MKRFLSVVVCLLFGLSTYAQSPNPIVQRLSDYEIQQNNTPAAVAYNFIFLLALENWDATIPYFTPERRSRFNNLAEYHKECEEAFNNPSREKLYIKGWLPALLGQWEIAVLYVQDEGHDEYGREMKKVYIGCVPSSQINNAGFQNIQRYGNTNVKVLVVNCNGHWRVNGFK